MALLDVKRILRSLLRRHKRALEARLQEVDELLEGDDAEPELIAAIRHVHRPLRHG